jgi:hypothetical protein
MYWARASPGAWQAEQWNYIEADLSLRGYQWYSFAASADKKHGMMIAVKGRK